MNKTGQSTKKITFEKIKEILEKEEYELLTPKNEYKNTHSIITYKCKNGHINSTTYKQWNKSEECLQCSWINRRYSFEFIKSTLEKEKYILLNKKYIYGRLRLDVICSSGHKINMLFSEFLIGKRCKQCYIDNIYYTYEEIRETVEKDEYKLLSSKEEYKNINSKIYIECPNGHKYYRRAHSFIIGSRCLQCSKSRKTTYEEVKQNIESVNYKLLTPKEEYKYSRTAINIECNNGHKYHCTYSSFRSGSRCPHCKRSRGEEKIMEYLDKSNIKYKHDHTFQDCRNILPLRFDFYLQQYNLIIEYDGGQHFKDVAWFKDGHKKTVINDKIKNKYCKNHGIKLIRIPYWDFDKIGIILDKHLTKYIIKSAS